MYLFWWIAYIVPLLMILAGCVGVRYRSPQRKLTEEQQAFANRQLRHMLWQFGMVFAALAFMVMRTVRLVPLGIQHWIAYGIVFLEILGVLLTVIPMERAIRAQFDDENNAEGDLNEN